MSVIVMRQLGWAIGPDIWSNIRLDVTVEAFLKCDQRVHQQTVSKADHRSQCGWSSSNQLRPLREKTEVPVGRTALPPDGFQT